MLLLVRKCVVAAALEPDGCQEGKTRDGTGAVGMPGPARVMLPVGELAGRCGHSRGARHLAHVGEEKKNARWGPFQGQ